LGSRLCETYVGSVRDGTVRSRDIPFALHGLSSLSAAPSEHVLETLVAWLLPDLRRVIRHFDRDRCELEAALGGLVWMGFRGGIPRSTSWWSSSRPGARASPASRPSVSRRGAPRAGGLACCGGALCAGARKVRAPFGLLLASRLAKCLYGLALARTEPNAALVSEVPAVLGDAEAVRGLRPRDLVNALWAMARHGLRPSEAAVAHLDEAVQAALPALSGAQLASALWALACLDHTYASVRRLTEALCNRAESCTPAGRPRQCGRSRSSEVTGLRTSRWARSAGSCVRHAQHLHLDHLTRSSGPSRRPATSCSRSSKREESLTLNLGETQPAAPGSKR
jgi:hypothetical protein